MITINTPLPTHQHNKLIDAIRDAVNSHLAPHSYDLTHCCIITPDIHSQRIISETLLSVLSASHK